MSNRSSIGRLRPPGWRTAAIVAALVLGGSITALASGQLGATDKRLPQVSEQQAREDLPGIFASGDPVVFGTVEVPKEVGAPETFGPFRLVPWGFVGDLPLERRQIPRGVQTENADLIKSSPLYRDVAPLMPQGMEFVGADTGVETTEDVVHSMYVSADQRGRIEVWSMRPSVLPYDIDLPDDGTWRTDSVAGRDLVVVNRVSGAKGNESGFFRVQVFVSDGDRVALVESNFFSEEKLIPIALSMFDRGN